MYMNVFECIYSCIKKCVCISIKWYSFYTKIGKSISNAYKLTVRTECIHFIHKIRTYTNTYVHIIKREMNTRSGIDLYSYTMYNCITDCILLSCTYLVCLLNAYLLNPKM